MSDSDSRHNSIIVEQFTRQAAPFARMHTAEESMELFKRVAGVTRDDIALDVACGPGLVACAFAKIAKHVSGVDITPAMLEQARQLQQRERLTNIEWNSISRDVWRMGLRHKHDARAEEAYLRQIAPEFLIVPALGDHIGPHGLNPRTPRAPAYACRGSGQLPSLSAFGNLDFFVLPPDFSWTMVYSHEDIAFGGLSGPFYFEREWLAPQIRGVDNAGKSDRVSRRRLREDG